jgi:Xaa-Pro aminopeptidase
MGQLAILHFRATNKESRKRGFRVARDKERLDRMQAAMQEAGLDAIACALPSNVLLLTGYFPVVGKSIAVMTRDSQVTLIVPQDERELADCNTADRLRTFDGGSPGGARKALRELGLDGLVVGYECGGTYEPSSYAAMHLYGTDVGGLLDGAVLRPASALLERMKSVLTPIELDRLRRACRIACIAFDQGWRSLTVGLKETEAAAAFRQPLITVGTGFEGVSRAEGFVFCMSGRHSGEAYGAYARSRSKEICVADLVLTHCNSHADGYWTDLTRTYCMGQASEQQQHMYEAVFAARQAALEAIRPGAKAGEIDRAAREVLRDRGFGPQFKHATGHGVGFAAIDHNARPRIAPDSGDWLESGMVFNVEPGIYFEGFGGVRHCDMVVVTETGAEVLSGFQCAIGELVK